MNEKRSITKYIYIQNITDKDPKSGVKENVTHKDISSAKHTARRQKYTVFNVLGNYFAPRILC